MRLVRASSADAYFVEQRRGAEGRDVVVLVSLVMGFICKFLFKQLKESN